jgi:GNAT superfamily N-acetyltransferase
MAVRAPSRRRFLPLTPDRWKDLEALFGPRGACAGCWCMWWRLSRPEFDAARGEGNRRAFAARVAERAPGLLAYDGGIPVGWVAIEPREAYPRIARSRNLRTEDGAEGVWSITCFYVARSHRGTGLMARLVDAAVAHARAEGASAVEAYPVDFEREVGDAFVYTGAASVFRRAGFEEVLRRSPTRPVMRRLIRRRAPGARARAPARSTPRSSRTRPSVSRRGR